MALKGQNLPKAEFDFFTKSSPKKESKYKI